MPRPPGSVLTQLARTEHSAAVTARRPFDVEVRQSVPARIETREALLVVR
jgi:hypothetical protein